LGGKARTETTFATLFLDIGHSGTNMGVARFFDGGWDVIGIDTVTSFCGELHDHRLIALLDEKFFAKFGSHFKQSKKAVSKVESVLVKMKKMLAVNQSANNTIDFLYDDRDFKCEITREELWNVVEPEITALLQHLRDFLGLCKDKLGDVPFETVEIVGGLSRMVDLKAAISQVCEETIGISTLQTTLNTNEALARGCVLQCAILSPRFAIAPKKVKDIIPFAVMVGRQPEGFPIEQWEQCKYEPLFPHWHELNKSKTITFKKPRSLRVILVQQSLSGERSLIGHADINCSQLELADGESWKKFQVIVDLNHSGLLKFRSEVTKSRIEVVDVQKTEEVPLTEEEYAEAVRVAQEEAMAKLQAEKEKKAAEAAAKATEEIESAENAEEQPENMEIEDEEAEPQMPEVNVPKTKTVEKTEKQEKTRLSKHAAPTTFTSRMGMTSPTIQSIKAQEKKMSDYDSECLLTGEARNNLEEYVLNAQGEFADGGQFFPYMSQEEADGFMNSIFEADDYLAMDEFDKMASEYIEKLNTLKTVGDIFEIRCREWEKRPQALAQAAKSVGIAQMWLNEGRQAEEFAHITDENVAELATKVAEFSQWLDELQQLHAQSQQAQDPPFYVREVQTRTVETNIALQAVKNTPAPPPPEPEKTEEKPEEAAPAPENAEAAAPEDGDKPDVEMENTEQ